ncbi:MAG: GNAT family N-acetyltransferase [Roseovarius sp.]
MIGVAFCRAMRRDETQAVAALLEACFESTAERRLVEQLRKDRVIAGEMVLPDQEGGIVGYYALSAMQAPKGWLCLAPVAVHPEWQGKGLGRRMIGQLSAWAQAAGQYVIVLGEAEFYERAGFERARAVHLQGPYPPENMLLAGPGQDTPEHTLIYPRAIREM